MKECSQCHETMFDGCKSCGICSCNDLIQLNPERQILIQKQKPKRSKARERLAKATSESNYNANFHGKRGIVRLSDTDYEVSSLTNPSKKYLIDLDNMRDHKGDCRGYRYKQDCNHLQRLREAGVKC